MNSETLCTGSDPVELITLETPGLGNRSYLLVADGWAVGVDVQRDLDRVRQILDERGLRLASVVETHIHNDYVTGGYALARERGARYVVPAGPALSFEAFRAEDSDTFDVGPLAISVIASPGHTDAHATYAVRVPGQPALGAFTGGSLLLGGTGRTDLLGADRAEELARAQYWSARRMSRLLPAEARILPTHGFGSFCLAGKAVASPGETMADQLEVNPAFQFDEDGFVRNLLGGLGPVPSYFPQMAPLNASGPQAADLRPAASMPLSSVREHLAHGRPVIDVRPRSDFAASHFAGSIGIDAAGALATWAGWSIGIEDAPVIVAADQGQLAYAQRELSRIGIDRPAGAVIWSDSLAQAEPDPALPASDGLELASLAVATFADLAAALDGDADGDAGGERIDVVDVRDAGEWRNGHLRGARRIPAHELAGDGLRSAGLSSDTWLHCVAGFRAVIAASRAQAEGIAVTVVDDSVSVAPDLLSWCDGQSCPDDRCASAVLVASGH